MKKQQHQEQQSDMEYFADIIASPTVYAMILIFILLLAAWNK